MKIFTCSCEGLHLKDNPHNLITKLEEFSKQAFNEQDYRKGHNFLQHAEHYKRVLNDR